MHRPVLAALALVTLSGVVAGCSGSSVPRDTTGQVTTSASADAFQVKVGDCVGNLASGEVKDVKLIPCAESHFYEAYAALNMDDTAYPGETKTKEQSGDFCEKEFKSFVGKSVNDSKYTYFYFYPTTASWKNGDREIMCLAGAAKGGVKGSLKGVKK